MSNFVDVLREDTDLVPSGQKWVVFGALIPDPEILMLREKFTMDMFIKITEALAKKHEKRSILKRYYEGNYEGKFLAKFYSDFRERNTAIIDKKFKQFMGDRIEPTISMLKCFGCFPTKQKALSILRIIRARGDEYKCWASQCGYWDGFCLPDNYMTTNKEDDMQSVMRSHIKGNIVAKEEFKRRRMILLAKEREKIVRAVSIDKDTNQALGETNIDEFVDEMDPEQLEFEYDLYDRKFR